MYMTTLPIADARAQLSKLVDEASSTHERIEITKNGRRAAVLMGADDYDAMRETIAVLSDSALLLAHEVGVQEFAKGDTLNADQLSEAVRNVGRSVDTK
ncbi:MAG: type II toxin-antitoxin system Phd/YefM family antitoxin [Acidimicrobiales bacterium]